MNLERLPLHISTLELPEIDLSSDVVQGVGLSPGDSLVVPSLTLQSESSESHAESEPEVEKEKSRAKKEKQKEKRDPTEKSSKKAGPSLGKRKRSAPAKYSSDGDTPSSSKKTRETRSNSKAVTKVKTEASDTPRVTKRGSRCGKCAGCMREDCGKCVYCLDKPKFGGPAKKKQRCALRTCSDFEHRRKAEWMKVVPRTEGNGSASSTPTIKDYAIKKSPSAEDVKGDLAKTPTPLSSKSSSTSSLPAIPPSASVPPKLVVSPAKTVSETKSRNSKPSKTSSIVAEPAKLSSKASTSTPKPSTSEAKSSTGASTLASTPKPSSSSSTPVAAAKKPGEPSGLEPVKSSASVLSSIMLSSTTPPAKNSIQASQVEKSAPFTVLPPTTVSSIAAPVSITGPVATTSPDSSDMLSSAKKTLASNQLSYARVAMQLESTKKLIDKTLKEHASLTEKSGKSPTITIPIISAGKAASLLKTDTTVIAPSKSSTLTTTPLSALPKTKIVKPSSANATTLVNLIVNSKPSVTPNASPKVSKSSSTTSAVLATTSKPKPVSTLTSGSAPKQVSTDSTVTSGSMVSSGTVTPSTKAPSAAMRPSVTAKLISSESPLVKGSISAPTLSSPSSTATTGTKKIITRASALKAQATATPPNPDPPMSGKRSVSDGGHRMVCVQCGRERYMGVARTSKFCTQRCIINWLEDNPDKAPKDAVGDDSVPPAKLTPAPKYSSSSADEKTPDDTPPSKPLPRALKNLQIDMAKPGTKLNLSSNSDSDSSSPSPSHGVGATTSEMLIPVSGNTSVRATLIESLANIISTSQQQGEPLSPVTSITKVPNASVAAGPKSVVASSKVKVSPGQAEKSKGAESSNGVSEESTTTTTSKGKASKGGVKRAPPAAPTPQNPPAKKHKSSSQSMKSVTFNLNPALSAVESVAPVALDRIASYLQPKKSAFETTKIKVPAGLPSDVRQWTVAQVVQYFKTTSDCANYVDLFESQEVDGIALLLLTHETLVKCLGIKLGRAVKIMNRVQELKHYHEHHRK